MLPVDCNNVESMPSDLMVAIDHALHILGWQENMMEDEMPERWKWHLDWEINRHFLDIKRKRNPENASSSSDEDSGETAWEENSYSARFS